IFYVKDFLDMGVYFRMNTIFKFYNQAWVLLALVSAMALYFLFEELTPDPVEAAIEPPAVQPSPARALETILVGGDGASRPALLQPEAEPAPLPIDAVVRRAEPAWWRRAFSFLNR